MFLAPRIARRWLPAAVLSPLLLLVTVGCKNSGRDKARDERLTKTNLKQLTLAMLMYAQDYDEHLPPSGDGERLKWYLASYIAPAPDNQPGAPSPRVEELFRQPGLPVAFYQLNPAVVGGSLARMPPETVCFYESTVRFGDGRYLSQLDGRVKYVPQTAWKTSPTTANLP